MFRISFVLAFVLLINLQIKVTAQDDVSANSSNGSQKRIDLPFVHIGINKHVDGQKDVEVRAPFVHVHNPAGPNNAQVKAPFTHVDHSPTGTYVKAPFTHVNNPPGPNNAQVKAPFTKVDHNSASSQYQKNQNTGNAQNNY